MGQRMRAMLQAVAAPTAISDTYWMRTMECIEFVGLLAHQEMKRPNLNKDKLTYPQIMGFSSLAPARYQSFVSLKNQ
jgi:hypothetical protein